MKESYFHARRQEDHIRGCRERSIILIFSIARAAEFFIEGCRATSSFGRGGHSSIEYGTATGNADGKRAFWQLVGSHPVGANDCHILSVYPNLLHVQTLESCARVEQNAVWHETRVLEIGILLNFTHDIARCTYRHSSLQSLCLIKCSICSYRPRSLTRTPHEWLKKTIHDKLVIF